ncbi:hypothetical protein HDV06_004412 [Boothiomyces sp. JEL0866]|nr:hypothetical protein HDV06_004412 [Boothiomyces sp. JEL0866]
MEKLNKAFENTMAGIQRDLQDTKFNFDDFKQIASNEFQALVNKLELPTKLDQMSGLEEGKVPLDPFQIALAHRYKIKQDELKVNVDLLDKETAQNDNQKQRLAEKTEELKALMASISEIKSKVL